MACGISLFGNGGDPTIGNNRAGDNGDVADADEPANMALSRTMILLRKAMVGDKRDG